VERWEIIERCVLVVAGACMLVIVGRFFFVGVWHPVVLLLVPIAAWALWQAFFEDKLHSAELPTATERVFALAWLWSRRIVLWAVGLILGGLSLVGLSGAHGLQSLVGPLVGLTVAGLALWVGAFGAGHQKSTSDDLRVHLARRKRYRW
jgi:hypothetical protein